MSDTTGTDQPTNNNEEGYASHSASAVAPGGDDGAAPQEEVDADSDSDSGSDDDPMSAANMAVLQQMMQEVIADPSLWQRPEYVHLRDLVELVRSRPDLYSRTNANGNGNDGDHDEGRPAHQRRRYAILECFCARGDGEAHDNNIESSGGDADHSDVCIALQKLRGDIHKKPFTFDRGEPIDENYFNTETLHDLALELYSKSQTVDADDPTNDAQLLKRKALKCYWMHVGRSDDLVSLIALEEIPFLLVDMGLHDELCALLADYASGWTRTADWKGEAEIGRFPFDIEEGHCLQGLNAIVNDVPIWTKNNGETLPFLVSFFLMKTHLVSKRRDERDAWAEQIRGMLDTTAGGQMMNPVRTTLLEMALGCKEYRDPLEDHISQTMDVIQARNPTILPALVRPAPLVEATPQPLAPVFFPRTPSEAFTTMQNAEPLYRKIPYARDVLVKRYGDTPQYHHDPFDYRADEVND